jgi:hypothetical protein
MDKIILFAVNFHHFWNSSYIAIWHKSAPAILDICDYCRYCEYVKVCDHNSRIGSLVCLRCYMTYVAKNINRKILINGKSVIIKGTLNPNNSTRCFNCHWSCVDSPSGWVVSKNGSYGVLCRSCFDEFYT